MSVWDHVGAAELCSVWVHRLWFKKTTRMKGSRAGGKTGRHSSKLSSEILPSSSAAAIRPEETQDGQPLPLPAILECCFSRSCRSTVHTP